MRFTRLLIVAWCAALLCASLGNAAATSDVEVSPSDEWQGLTVKSNLSPDVEETGGRCAMFSDSAKDFYGNEVPCTDSDTIIDSGMYLYALEESKSTIKSLLQVQHSSLSFTAADFKVVCSEFALRVPSRYELNGADFFIFITLRPMGADGHSLLSKVCTWDKTNGRPTSGVLNIAAQYPRNTVSGKRGLTAEILRMLGFNTTVFANKNMVTRATVRGVESVPLVNSPMVLQMARDFYGCRTLPGMELDYDSTNDNAPLPYWRGRVAKDDVMSSAGNMYYVTPMTLAAMEDTGFYKGNYANADLMPWGYKAGCDFVTQKCVEGGKSNFGNLFCTDGLYSPPVSHCTSDHLAIGHCGMGKASGDLPSPFQYFADAAEGGSLSTMDYCPVVHADVSDMCLGGNGYAVSFYHDLLRCIDTKDTGASSGGSAACLPVTCNYTDRTFLISTTRARLLNVPCPAGEVLNVSNIKDKGMFTRGFIYCPQFEEVCPVRYPYTANVPDHTSSTGAETSSAADLLHPSRWHDRMLNGVIWSCVLVALVAYAVLHSCLCKVPPFVYPM